MLGHGQIESADFTGDQASYRFFQVKFIHLETEIGIIESQEFKSGVVHLRRKAVCYGIAQKLPEILSFL